MRLVQQETLEAVTLPRKAVSRRALYRVETGALHLDAAIRVGATTAQGRLLNISAAGCCLALASAAPFALDKGATASVTLRTNAHTLICNAEIVSFDVAEAATEVRLRFRALAPQTQRALLAWIKELATADFQRRHTRTVSH